MATERGRFSWKGLFGENKEPWGASALRTKSNLKFKLILSGKTLNSHKHFIDRLNQLVHLKEVNTEDECDFILGFCTIVSRAGTDIEAAKKRLHNFSDTKPVVLVVLHHTFDTECVVPDSSKCVNRKNMIAVDCLFYEDTGLLQCLKNNESLDKTSQYLEKEQHIKLKKQEQEQRKSTRVNAEKDEELNDTNMKPKKILSNETQEGKNSPHERNQQLNKIEIVEEIVKRKEEDLEDLKDLKEMIIVSEKQKTDLEEKNRQLLGQLKQLESVVKKMEIKLTEGDKELQEKYRLLTENTQTLQKMDKTLEEKEKHQKQTRAELDKTIKLLEDSQRHVEEKNTQVENLNKLLKEKETQLKNTDKELETSTNKLDTLGQELQVKQRQLQDMMIVVEQQEAELAEKKQQLQEKDRLQTEGPNFMELKGTQLKQEKKEEEEEKEEEDANTGNGNTGLKNNEHLTKEKGTISKATNTELEKNRSPYEGQQPVLDYPQIRESQAEVEEREIKTVEDNKELIEKNKMSPGIQLKGNETVQYVHSNKFAEADLMLMENKKQLKHVTENQHPGPKTQEEESDEQHEEKKTKQPRKYRRQR
ncbi:interaptin-like [Tachysurus fulvidraco]|uniref:interaptin-like n=1 Tax=Tachysurus fulvidraco TaxID=1234273 RepID=UPI001FEDD62C|nr:interaptin-like [Tachysurus fulvidraco]